MTTPTPNGLPAQQANTASTVAASSAAPARTKGDGGNSSLGTFGV
jgi:hypothetical protein